MEDESPPLDPSLNGGPLLHQSQVSDWFEESCGFTPSEDEAIKIAKCLNHHALLAVAWKSNSTLNEIRMNSPEKGRRNSIYKSLLTLKRDISEEVAHTLRYDVHAQSGTYSKESTYGKLLALSELTESLIPAFEIYHEGRGKKPEKWHNVARILKKMINDVGVAHGVKIGFSGPETLGIKLLKTMLSWLGVIKEESGIVSALTRP